MKAIIKRFCKNEAGATAIEYGLIAALIAVVIMVGAGLLGTNLDALFTRIANILSTQAPTGTGG